MAVTSAGRPIENRRRTRDLAFSSTGSSTSRSNASTCITAKPGLTRWSRWLGMRSQTLRCLAFPEVIVQVSATFGESKSRLRGSARGDQSVLMTGHPMDKRVREAIVRARKNALSYEEIAELLGVGPATLSRVLRLERETGGVQPRPRGGGNPSFIRDGVAALLEKHVTKTPDATVLELTTELCARAKIEVSRASVQCALTRLGYTRKKDVLCG